ncbi:hypothetical protein F4678DRAFT_464210 [Xylaria arbuscula]|nr:hypothetical protein F4678DRAFT_464210 [Xylaria arbuscula]
MAALRSLYASINWLRAALTAATAARAAVEARAASLEEENRGLRAHIGESPPTEFVHSSVLTAWMYKAAITSAAGTRPCLLGPPGATDSRGSLASCCQP